MLMEKSFDKEKNTWNVKLFGDVDLYNLDELKEGLGQIEGADVNIFCEHLKYIDSSGLGVLVTLLSKSAKNGRRVSIKGLKPHLYKLFELTGLNSVFDIEVG